jgi:patatin-like phospholipase/acyl hydrolase
MRGIVPATVLAALEARAERPVSELFDLVAGTSTGGLIACALVAPGPQGGPRFTAAEVLGLYHAAGPAVFAGDEPERALEDALRALLGDLRLSDALVDLLVPAYDVAARRPWVFASWRAGFDPPLWQVARATSADPARFGPLRVEGPGGRPLVLADGGAVAVDPTALAVREARARPRVVVSLATGASRADPDEAPGRHRLGLPAGLRLDGYDASEPARARLQRLGDELVAERSAQLDAVVAELLAGA